MGTLLGGLGPLLAPPWGALGRSWRLLGPLLALLGRPWAARGGSWGRPWPSWAAPWLLLAATGTDCFLAAPGCSWLLLATAGCWLLLLLICLLAWLACLLAATNPSAPTDRKAMEYTLTNCTTNRLHHSHCGGPFAQDNFNRNCHSSLGRDENKEGCGFERSQQ